MSIGNKYILLSLLSVFFCLTLTHSTRALEVEAISMPSADILLSFVMTGKVSELLVEEGDPIEKETFLAALDTRTEQLKVEELKIIAEDTTRVKVATAELNQKEIDLKKLSSAQKKGAVTKWELEHARLNAHIAKLSLRAVILENKQNQQRYEHAKSQLDRMRITAPISGSVEKVMISPGESVKSLDPVVQIIQIDPLWMDVPVPMSRIKELSKGQMVSILFPNAQPDETAEGEIIHISSIADAASDTLRVRVAAPNPKKHKAGERVIVKFSEEEHLENEPVEASSNESLSIMAPEAKP